MKRRLALLALLALPGAALAQEAPPPAPAAQPAPRPRPRPARPRVDNRPMPNDGAFMGGGMVVQQPALVPRGSAAGGGDLAPRPDMTMEAPRGPARREPEMTLEPSVIAPRLPGRGVTRQGRSDVNPLDDRLFQPAPGAHIRMPMTW